LKTGAPVPVVAITAVLLAGYMGLVVWGLASPSNDPQRGMAQGFLSMVAFCLLCLAGLLWLGAAKGYPKLVWTIFGICMLPSLSLVARGIYLLVRWIRRE
jgi:hypothetical protein